MAQHQRGCAIYFHWGRFGYFLRFRPFQIPVSAPSIKWPWNRTSAPGTFTPVYIYTWTGASMRTGMCHEQEITWNNNDMTRILTVFSSPVLYCFVFSLSDRTLSHLPDFVTCSIMFLLPISSPQSFGREPKRIRSITLITVALIESILTDTNRYYSSI